MYRKVGAEKEANSLMGDFSAALVDRSGLDAGQLGVTLPSIRVTLPWTYLTIAPASCLSLHHTNAAVQSCRKTRIMSK